MDEADQMMRTSSNRGKDQKTMSVHPDWMTFIRYCEDLGFGELEKIRIRNGIPVMAEQAIKKIKFSSEAHNGNHPRENDGR